MYVYMFVFIYIYICTHTYVCIHTISYIYIYICIYIYVYAYKYIYIYIYTDSALINMQVFEFSSSRLWQHYQAQQTSVNEQMLAVAERLIVGVAITLAHTVLASAVVRLMLSNNVSNN